MNHLISHPSPNYEERKGAARPSLVVLHYTGMQSGATALARLCDKAVKVSAHYLIEEDGRIFVLVDEAHRAWHAGVSFWRGITDINSHSIGIEIVNPGHECGYRPFPEAQMQAVLRLCLDIKARYGLLSQAFLGHSDIAPLRKTDPGEYFDWPMLAQHGVGLWPEKKNTAILDEHTAFQLLEKIGYQPATNHEEKNAVIRAFQRRYRPALLSGMMDDETRVLIANLAALQPQ